MAAAAMFSAVTPLPEESAALKVCDFADHQIVQRRIGAHSAAVSVLVEGAVPDGASVEAAVVQAEDGVPVTPWIALDRDNGRRMYCGVLEVPQGGWYHLAARSTAPGGVVIAADIGTSRWAVGLNILCIGQSNMVGNGSIHEYTPVTAQVCGLFGNDNVWRELADPYDNAGAPTDIDYDVWVGASAVPALVNELARLLPGVPLGIVAAAKGGTALCGTCPTCWLTRNGSNHADPATLYGNSVRKACLAGGVEIIIMHQGESDATDGRSSEEYVAALKTLLAHYREDLHPSVPLFICQIGRAVSTDRNRTDVTMQAIRRAQLLADNGRDIYLAALCVDFANKDGDHYDKAGYDALGRRIAAAIAYHFGAPVHYRGPSIATARFAGSGRDTVLVTVRHRGGNDITPAAGITGFEVFDDTQRVPVSAALRESPDTIRLRLAAPVKGKATVRYLYGKCPDVSACVREDTPAALPLEPTADPLEIVAEH